LVLEDAATFGKSASNISTASKLSSVRTDELERPGGDFTKLLWTVEDV
jgi:hypothetical protein